MSQVTLGAYGLTFSWGGSLTAPVLEDVTFELERGELLALFGPNGSGKSTLMKLIAGVLPLDRSRCTGQVRYLGQDFWAASPHQRAQSVVYVGPDLRAEFPLTALEAVLLGRSCRNRSFFNRASKEDRKAIQWAMERCLCWGLRDRLLDTLSGGERQLVALASALAHGARVLLLDEVLSRMDLNHQVQIGQMLKDLATKDQWSILLVSHDMNLALEWADSAFFLKKGRKIAQGSVQNVLTESTLRSLYPGADLVIGKNPATGRPKVFFGSANQALIKT